MKRFISSIIITFTLLVPAILFADNNNQIILKSYTDNHDYICSSNMCTNSHKEWESILRKQKDNIELTCNSGSFSHQSCLRTKEIYKHYKQCRALCETRFHCQDRDLTTGKCKSGVFW